MFTAAAAAAPWCHLVPQHCHSSDYKSRRGLSWVLRATFCDCFLLAHKNSLNSKIAKFKITNCIDVATATTVAAFVVFCKLLTVVVNFADWQAATAIAAAVVVVIVGVVLLSMKL